MRPGFKAGPPKDKQFSNPPPLRGVYLNKSHTFREMSKPAVPWRSGGKSQKDSMASTYTWKPNPYSDPKKTPRSGSGVSTKGFRTGRPVEPKTAFPPSEPSEQKEKAMREIRFGLKPASKARPFLSGSPRALFDDSIKTLRPLNGESERRGKTADGSLSSRSRSSGRIYRQPYKNQRDKGYFSSYPPHKPDPEAPRPKYRDEAKGKPMYFIRSQTRPARPIAVRERYT